MSENQHFLVENRSRIPGVGARSWHVHYPREQSTAWHGLDAAGWTEAETGLTLVMSRPNTALVLISLSGAGEVLMAGGWQRCDAGMLYYCPAGQERGKRAMPEMPWQHAWVRWHEVPAVPPRACSLFVAPWQALYASIEGLHHEEMEEGRPELIEKWADLIVDYARRLTSGETRRPATLRSLWEEVIEMPAFPWSMPVLAEKAALSDEALRLNCRRETGRAPMAQVAYLRMRLAASFLTVDYEPISVIAHRVGYADAYSFSTAFKRLMGLPPSEYRRRAMER
jgi:AraC-like DNA-binding protein